MRAVLFGAIVATALAVSPASAQLVNGDFEDAPQPTPPSNYIQYGSVPGPTINGWTVTGDASNAILGLSSAYTEPSVTFLPNTGNVSLDLTGAGNTGPNGIYQDVSLGNALYSLSFALGNIGGGTDGNQTAYTLPATIDVYINNLLAGSFTNSTGPAGAVNWASQSLTFQAAGLTRIEFRNATPRGDNYAGLDSVVLSAVPEPAAWAMLLVGFGFVGGALRRRARVAAIAV